MIPVPKTLRDGTDCHRLFLALRDGQPHTHHELYRLGMIVHSRKSDLVHRHGCLIDVWSTGGTSFYQLRSLNESVGHSSPESSADSLSATVRKGESSEDGRLLADGTPSYGPLTTDGPTGSAESASLAPGSLSTPGAGPASQLLIWEAA